MPPPPPTTPPPASAAAAPQAAVLQSVQGLASYSDALADFLDQWNSVLLDVASIAATFAVLFPAAESDDVVVEMINKDMYLQAIRLILAFEFQNAFPLGQILTHIMEKVEHGRKEESEELALIKRDEEELTLLRSITKCVLDHKLCPSEFSALSITERIALLEERLGKPKQAFTGIKRKRTTDEDNVELNAL